MNIDDYIEDQFPAPRRNDLPPDERAKLRSYTRMRLVIGVVGLVFPFVLIALDRFLDGRLRFRSSLSDYYFSGARDVFVGFLIAIGVFLLTYRVREVRKVENWLGSIAGLAALVVALAPMEVPRGGSPTPLQIARGEDAVATWHYSAAITFFVAILLICVGFGIVEGKRDATTRGDLPPSFWRMFHFGCALVIAAALVYVILGRTAADPPAYYLLIGESVAVVAFSISWLFKGWESKVLTSNGK